MPETVVKSVRLMWKKYSGLDLPGPAESVTVLSPEGFDASRLAWNHDRLLVAPYFYEDDGLEVVLSIDTSAEMHPEHQEGVLEDLKAQLLSEASALMAQFESCASATWPVDLTGAAAKAEQEIKSLATNQKKLTRLVYRVLLGWHPTTEQEKITPAGE